MTTTPHGIDLSFRPQSYFWPMDLPKHLLTRVKGTARKAALHYLIEEGQLHNASEFVTLSSLPEPERQAFGRLHPSCMGGEFLPELAADELEIARLELKSTTSDVVSVYARRGDGCIHYHVVDEYDGETLTGNNERTALGPLTLGELVEFFLGAWPMMDVLRMNFDDDLEEMLWFFDGRSQFYDDFDEVLRRHVIARVPPRADPDADEDDDEDAA